MLLRKKEDAVREIMARTPDGARDFMQQLVRDLQDPSMMMVVAHSDPEIARLLGVVQSIHHATAMKKAASLPAAPEQQPVVSVRVGLVSDLLPPGVLARVIRRPDDHGIPIVLLPESQATPADILMATYVAVASFKKHGKTPNRATQEDYTTKPVDDGVSAARLSTAELYLNWLRVRAPKDIPGVGLAKIMEVATLLNQPARPKV